MRAAGFAHSLGSVAPPDSSQLVSKIRGTDQVDRSQGVRPGGLRLAGSILLEVHDEWQIAQRSYLSEASMVKLYADDQQGANTKEVGTKTKELLAG